MFALAIENVSASSFLPIIAVAPNAVFCPAGLEREKLLSTAAYGATIYEVRGTYDDCSRLTVELSFELPWAFVNVNLRSYYAEGAKTMGFEIVEQLGWRYPRHVVSPVAGGTLLPRILRGFRELAEIGLETVGSTPDELAAYQRAEIAKWARVVKESGAKVE